MLAGERLVGIYSGWGALDKDEGSISKAHRPQGSEMWQVGHPPGTFSETIRGHLPGQSLWKLRPSKFRELVEPATLGIPRKGIPQLPRQLRWEPRRGLPTP